MTDAYTLRALRWWCSPSDHLSGPDGRDQEETPRARPGKSTNGLPQACYHYCVSSSLAHQGPYLYTAGTIMTCGSGRVGRTRSESRTGALAESDNYSTWMEFVCMSFAF